MSGSWVWLQIRKLGPPQPRGQARRWVQAKPPHKGPLWLLSLALGSASPSGSWKMLPVWQLLEPSVLGQGTGSTPGLLSPSGILDASSSELLGAATISQPVSLRLRRWALASQHPRTRTQHSGHFFSSHCPQEAVGLGLREEKRLSHHIVDCGRVWVK